jgi:hypothetical protein
MAVRKIIAATLGELLRRPQISGLEPFDERAIDRCQEIACLADTTLVAPQLGEAHRSPQWG